MLLRLSMLTIAVLLVSLGACGDGDGEAPPDSPANNVSTIVPVTPAAKPASVPQSAEATRETATLGTIARRANRPPETEDTRQLRDASCEQDVIVLETPEETIYAARSCDGFWDEKAKDQFVGKEVAIVLEVSDVRFRILVETLAGAQAEFTVAGIWVQ